VRLAVVGNVAYYMLLSGAVHLIGIAPSSLIVGVLPVTVTLAGLGDHGAVPLRRLAAPLALVIAGIVCINVDLFTSEAAHATTLAQKLAGIACAAGALASWTWYAVANARYLQRHHHFGGNEWSVLWGVVTGLIGGLCWIAILALPELAAMPFARRVAKITCLRAAAEHAAAARAATKGATAKGAGAKGALAAARTAGGAPPAPTPGSLLSPAAPRRIGAMKPSVDTRTHSLGSVVGGVMCAARGGRAAERRERTSRRHIFHYRLLFQSHD
jgi:hypothetical protein